MCGRITQRRLKLEYVREIGWDVNDFTRLPGERIPNWDVQPDLNARLMQRSGIPYSVRRDDEPLAGICIRLGTAPPHTQPHPDFR